VSGPFLGDERACSFVWPNVGSEGVPRCSYDDCPSFDGKRCEQLGFRPEDICEPAVLVLIRRLAEAEGKRDRSDRARPDSKEGGLVPTQHSDEPTGGRPG